MFRAAIFDLDGVITDTAVYHYKAWKAMASRIGIEIDEAFNETLKGVNRADSLERILVHGGKAGQFGAAERERLAAEKNEAYVASLSALSEADILPGIKQLLLDLRSHGIRIGLASASKNAEMILIALHIRELFDAVADAAAVPKGKPAPDIFLEAARLLDVAPSECVGLEDSLAGIESINAAGMISVGIGDVDLLGAQGADILFAGTGHVTYASLTERIAARDLADGA